MDSWTEKQLAIMKLGGNQACRVFFETHAVISTTTTTKTDIVDTVKERFSSPALKSLMNQNDDDDGRLVLVSITKPTTSIASRIVMGLWEWTVHRFPILLGGCRPIQLTEYMSKDEWNVLEGTTKSVFGYTSEIVVAAPNPEAIEYSRTEYGRSNPIPRL